MTRQVCLRGPWKPLASPFGSGVSVLTLLCGHLWSWNVDKQGEVPAEVDCIHCDREERVRQGLEPPGPWDSPLADAVIKYRAEQAAISQNGDSMNLITNTHIALICHEANRMFCRLTGDNSQKHWDDAEEWQRDSAIKGVEFAIANPDAPASAQHDAWVKDKVDNGWVYGTEKDATLKTHPCIVPYEALPLVQQMKDHLFRNIVTALTVKE